MKPKINNRQKILDAANHLFCEKGIGHTSLSDIAKATGISKGTLYYYYSSKNDLIFDIAEDHIEKISDDLFSLIATNSFKETPEKVMKILYKRILRHESRNRLHLYLVQEAISGNDPLKKRFRINYAKWKALVEEGFSKLFPNGSNHTIWSHMLVAMLDGMILQQMLNVQEGPIDDILQKISTYSSD